MRAMLGKMGGKDIRRLQQGSYMYGFECQIGI
jgi:hypothetical protein